MGGRGSGKKPLTQTEAQLSLRRRFQSTAVEETPSGCWLWRGRITRSGYGVLASGRTNVRAHRVAYELHVGPPGALLVCHRRDVPSCVNPAHLFLGTDADNSRDRVNKARGPRGENHHKAKLTKAQVAEIRSIKGKSQQEIASAYGVHRNTVRLIQRGETWRSSPTNWRVDQSQQQDVEIADE